MPVSMWIVVEGVLCLLAFIFRKRLGFIGYQVAVAASYLVALCFELTLDYTMSVYFAFAVIPYLKHIKLPTMWEFALAIYLMGSALIGMLANGFVTVVSLLVIHYLGPLCLIYIFCHIPRDEMFPRISMSLQELHGYVEKVLITCMAIEAIVGFIAIATSPDGRLMLNYQCVSGCVACVCVILLSFQLRDKYHVTFDYICMAYCMAWAFISGTRGYIVLAFVMAAAVIATQKDNRSKALLVCVLGALACILILTNSDFFIGLLNGSRMTESTGRRSWENHWFINLFASQGLLKDAFGIGIGTQFSSQPGAVAAFSGVGADDYSYRIIMRDTTLHNFWFTMTLCTGVVGTFLYVAVFVRFAQSLMRMQEGSGTSRTLLVIFMATYAFVLWYRWTATGGILESAMLCTLLALYQSPPKEETEFLDLNDGCNPVSTRFN